MSPLDDLLNSPLKPPSNELESGSIFDLALHQLPTSSSSSSRAKPKMTTGEVNSLAESLVEGYLQYFAAADASITWIAAEQEHSLWLDDQTLLVGRIDAVGATEEGEQFFLELKTEKLPWKTRIDEWRVTWKMSPQSLTYGVLAEAAYPNLRRFTVRKAYKSSPPQYAYEWYRFQPAEVTWWKGELIRIAGEIRSRRAEGVKGVPWSPKFGACFKYGAQYVCPRFHPACSQLKWDAEIANAVPRVPHLEVERNFLAENVGSFGQPMRKGVVVLDATRVDKWLDCSERYRGEYELGQREPEGEALAIGSDFHNLLRLYHAGLIKPR
jgi:hypothetical protein